VASSSSCRGKKIRATSKEGSQIYHAGTNGLVYQIKNEAALERAGALGVEVSREQIGRS